ncbi:unnamed protein product [Trichobilharzia szidati]|nr:unnamed protein product [Trichobilharzia szidati]
MAKCCISGEKFVNFVFSPCIGLLVSADVNELCLKDNLTFEELLRPFSQLSRDGLSNAFISLKSSVTFRDSSNVVHTVRNLQLKFFDATSTPAHNRATHSLYQYFVSVCSTDNTIRSQRFSNGNRSVIVPTSLPWFEAWRYLFITNLRSPYEHEFLNHNLACIFVITTGHPDPIRGFTELTQNQSIQQHHSGSGFPFWFTENVLKFYVLLHDGSSNIGQSCVDGIFNQVKTTFGAGNCHLLTIFTPLENTKIPSSTTLSSSNSNTNLSNNLCSSQINGLTSQVSHTLQPGNEPQSDPWLNHLLPHGYRPQLDQKLWLANNDHEGGMMTMTTINPSPPTCQLVNSNISLNSDPLNTAQSEVEESQTLGQNKISPYGTTYLSSENVAFQLYTFLPPRYYQPHGQHLTQADRDRIRMFVYDFSVRALLPWVEKTMRNLNDQIAHRMRLSRSFFSATKKFFTQAVGGGGGGGAGGTSSTVINNTPIATNTSSLTTSKIYSNPSPTDMSISYTSHPTDISNPITVNGPKLELSSPGTTPLPSQATAAVSSSSTVVYSPDSPEAQMRRLADLAFLFQQYEVAYQTYNVLKRDFQNDSAWLHYAGAQEMSALSIYLQGSTSQRQYPFHLMDSAVTTYLQSHLYPELALRSTLLNFEALCSRGLYNEAAMALIRLTSDEDDLVSGLLIEQIAHCVLCLKRPMLRKFAFRMALAAHRYSRAKQPHLAIRSYKSAMPIVMGHGWSLLEDHINFNVGRQAYLIDDLIGSTKALAETLNASSRQSAERQLFFVKEYLTVLTKVLSTGGYSENHLSIEQKALPEFPLPIIDLHNFKVMIGKPSQHHQQQADNKHVQRESYPDLYIEARGIQFSDAEDEDNEDDGEGGGGEEGLSIDEGLLDSTELQFQQFTNQYHKWMEATDVSSSDESSLDDDNDEDPENSNKSCNPFQNNNNNNEDDLNYTVTRRKVISPQTMISRRLEYILLQSACHSKICGLPFKRDKIIFTSKSRLKKTPSVPVGEHLTVQMTLINPMRIPLVFTNVHLLWVFTLGSNSPITTTTTATPPPTSYSTDGTVDKSILQNQHSNSTTDKLISITNEIVNHSNQYYHQQIQQQLQLVSQYVSSQILNEFIMLPGERKNLQLSLVAKQMGQITITGLGFEWSYLSPHQSNSDSNQQQQHSQLNHVVSLSSQNGSIPNSYSPTNQVAYNSPLQNNLSIDKSLTKANTVSETMMMMTNYTNSTLPLQSNQSSNMLTKNLSNTTTTITPTAAATPTGERNSVKGKILFNKKQVDNKNRSPIKLPLNWSVTHPAPALRVFFSSFPNQLYEGEICCIQISLTNSGLIPLTNLRVASIWPGLFAFGSITPTTTTTKVFDGSNEPVQYFSVQPLKPWIDIPCNSSTLSSKTDNPPLLLMPGTTISQTLWLRGPHLTYPSSRRAHKESLAYRPTTAAATTTAVYGSSSIKSIGSSNTSVSSGYSSVSGVSGSANTSVSASPPPPAPLLPPPPPLASTSVMLVPHTQYKTVQVVFQYESSNRLLTNQSQPIEQSKQLIPGCRYVRHRCEMELKPSLHFQAIANCLNSTDINNLLITVQITNVVNSAVPVTFQIMQILCISRYWTIKPIEADANIGITPRLQTGEVISLHFKATPVKIDSTYANGKEKQEQHGSNDSLRKYLSHIHFNHDFNQSNSVQQQNGAFLPQTTHDLQNSVVSPQSQAILPHQLEFFCRSGINWCTSSIKSNVSDLNTDYCISPLDINLIITWKGLSDITPNSIHHQQTIYGQSHLRINRLNIPVQTPYRLNKNNDNLMSEKVNNRKYRKTKRRVRKMKHHPKKEQAGEEKQELEEPEFTESDLSNLVQFRLDYPRRVCFVNTNDNIPDGRHHNLHQNISDMNDILSPIDLNSHPSPLILDGDQNRLSCRQIKRPLTVICVQAEVYNSSKWPIIVQLDMNRKVDNKCESVSTRSQLPTSSSLQHQQINPFRVYSSSCSPPHMATDIREKSSVSSLIWIGLTKHEFHLQPYETKLLTLKALAPHPGVYNACTFTVKAAALSPLTCDSHSTRNEKKQQHLFIPQNIFPLTSSKNHDMLYLIIVE